MYVIFKISIQSQSLGIKELEITRCQKLKRSEDQSSEACAGTWSPQGGTLWERATQCVQAVVRL